MLKYVLPPFASEKYANDALKILGKIKHDIPEALEVMLRSDVVLTLSGVRAQTTYVGFPKLSNQLKQKLVAALQDTDIDLFDTQSDVIAHDEPENWFVNNRAALDDLPNRYPLDIFPAIKKPIASVDAHSIWSSCVEAMIIQLIDSSEDSNPVLAHDLWSPHNIRFGMLLGYPAQAIESLCSLPKGEPSVEASIKYHDMYDAAWPVYSFGKEAADDQAIIKHQALWSEILTRVYESDWHKEYSLGK